MYIGKAYAKTAKKKTLDAFGKMQKAKIFKDASNSIGELSAKYKKLPKNYKKPNEKKIRKGKLDRKIKKRKKKASTTRMLQGITESK